MLEIFFFFFSDLVSKCNLVSTVTSHPSQMRTRPLSVTMIDLRCIDVLCN
jgi:hypothetical protein